MTDPQSRREFLRRALMSASAAALAACTGGEPDPTRRPGRARSPSPRPTVSAEKDPVRLIETQWPIKRVVYVMMENRSFDHMFGRFPGANGTTVGVDEGRERPLAKATHWIASDIPHDYHATERHVNGGRMDGFGGTDEGPSAPYFAYTQHDETTIPNYFHWARNYVLCDNFFASAIGNSYPQHLYFIAGQSGGAFDSPTNAHPREVDGRRFKTWGCDHFPDQRLIVKRPDGTFAERDPCNDFRTVGEQLTDREIDWGSYAATNLQIGWIWNSYAHVRAVYHSPLFRRHVHPVDDIVRDIRAGYLPAVTWVTPRMELSDHPPWSTGYAHNWVTELVNAIMRSHMWEHTAIFVTWDEWGGFYDHVVPPTVDYLGFGVRVPMLIISPWTKRGYVDDAEAEFSTPLRFIADNWGLPHLTPRIERAHNYEHVFDFERRKPRPPDPRPLLTDLYGEPFELPAPDPSWPEEFLDEPIQL